MDMNATQRRMELFALLQREGSVSVRDLAARFGVTAMTIRRDLSLFEWQGLITTNYGGAVLKRGTGIEPSFAFKRGQKMEAKQRIAQKAAAYISDGDTVILDCGTTTLELLHYIGRKKITLITNSWPAVSYLHGNPHVKLYLAPGKYDTVSAGAICSMTIAFFQAFHADIVFMGTHGFCPDYGATVPDPMDASVKSALLKQGKMKLLLADSSKMGQICFSQYALPDQFDTLITDENISREMRLSLEEHCPAVEVV